MRFSAATRRWDPYPRRGTPTCAPDRSTPATSACACRRAALEQAAAAVEAAGKDDPELAGRISVSGIYRPEDPHAVTDTMMQVFVHTDVLACGLVTLGQHIELQWHVPQ
ncbi:hypothetical protein GCM10023205_82660 [Yinghuangia aomiensis]|uniref:Uncharacterized protein n=1 Tax=Yinghuangia aomiensis TaxID=676205 RepID=A0ABP9IGV3_9ACTN